jgi:hypothetical protein
MSRTGLGGRRVTQRLATCPCKPCIVHDFSHCELHVIPQPTIMTITYPPGVQSKAGAMIMLALWRWAWRRDPSIIARRIVSYVTRASQDLPRSTIPRAPFQLCTRAGCTHRANKDCSRLSCRACCLSSGQSQVCRAGGHRPAPATAGLTKPPAATSPFHSNPTQSSPTVQPRLQPTSSSGSQKISPTIPQASTLSVPNLPHPQPHLQQASTKQSKQTSPNGKASSLPSPPVQQPSISISETSPPSVSNPPHTQPHLPQASTKQSKQTSPNGKASSLPSPPVQQPSTPISDSSPPSVSNLPHTDPHLQQASTKHSKQTSAINPITPPTRQSKRKQRDTVRYCFSLFVRLSAFFTVIFLTVFIVARIGQKTSDRNGLQGTMRLSRRPDLDCLLTQMSIVGYASSHSTMRALVKAARHADVRIA